MPLRRILLPVDFSERSIGAARYALALSRHFDSLLTFVHVLPPLHPEYGALEIGGSMLSELYRNRLDQAARELDKYMGEEVAGTRVERLVLEGDPAHRIVELAHGFGGASVILMPTHGYGPFRRFILGSTTAKVLHDADCPVWTGVHLEEAPTLDAIPIQSILCAVDLGPQSARAIDWAASVARQLGARLHLMHALGTTPEGDGESVLQWQKTVRDPAAEELRRLKSAVGVEATDNVESGEATKAIVSCTTRVKANLLVIGRGSAPGVFGRLRTNAYAIIRESPCPVVSV